MAFLKKLWAIRFVDRLVWTAAEFGVGYLTVHFGGSTVAGVSVAAALLFVKEFIVAQLNAAGGPVK